MTPSNATIDLYRGRDGLWRARVEWTDAETGEQRVQSWRDVPGCACPAFAASDAVDWWRDGEVGL